MRAHAEILAEFRGYCRCCWYLIASSFVMAALILYADPSAWPPAAMAIVGFGGGGVVILWKLRGVKSHGRSALYLKDEQTRRDYGKLQKTAATVR